VSLVGVSERGGDERETKGERQSAGAEEIASAADREKALAFSLSDWKKPGLLSKKALAFFCLTGKKPRAFFK
jgi:hypothetical protein